MKNRASQTKANKGLELNLKCCSSSLFCSELQIRHLRVHLREKQHMNRDEQPHAFHIGADLRGLQAYSDLMWHPTWRRHGAHHSLKLLSVTNLETPPVWHWGVKCRCLRCENSSRQGGSPWFLVLRTLSFTPRNGAKVPKIEFVFRLEEGRVWDGQKQQSVWIGPVVLSH